MLRPAGSPDPNKSAVVASLIAVYIIWGSTYLAIRFGLEGIPPFALNGIRFLVAGAGLYAFLRLRGAPRPTRAQVWNAARMGVLLIVGGVGGMALAIHHGVGSGLAATAAAVIPVWSALVAGLFGDWPTRREWIGLAVGFAGVVVLVQEGDFKASALGLLFAVIAPLLWSIGSVWGSRKDLPEGLMTSTVHFFAGGAVLMVMSFFLGETFTEVPSAGSIAALLYLIVLGSIVSFPAYVYLLRNVRPALATSYAYVNPAVAVVLGLTIGQEAVTGPLLIALPLILGGVAMVRMGSRSPQIAEPNPDDVVPEAA